MRARSPEAAELTLLNDDAARSCWEHPERYYCCEELEMPFLFHMASEGAEPYYGVVDAPAFRRWSASSGTSRG